MQTKNYYTILEVDAAATTEEIKKAYRKLAFKYHPDKNNGEQVAAIQFQEIQKAYETLSDPRLRAAYNQKRWYSKHALKKDTAEPLTAFKIFSKSNELKIYIRQLHPADINKPSLFNYLKQLLSSRSIHVLQQAKDPALNKQVIFAVLDVLEPLPASDRIVILSRLSGIEDDETAVVINKKLKDASGVLLWERYQVLVVLLLSIIICLLIFVVSK